MPVMQELLDYTHSLESAIMNLGKERRNYQMATSQFNRSSIINNKVLIASLVLIQQKVNNKAKAYLQTLLTFVEQRGLNMIV